MSVTVADLLKPRGPVETTLFPGEDDGEDGSPLYLRLEGYLERAEVVAGAIAFVDPDPAVKLYALYLTFDAAYIVAVSNPATRDKQVEILGRKSYDKDQRDALKDKAAEYLAAYDLLVAEVPTDAQPISPQSRTVANVFDW